MDSWLSGSSTWGCLCLHTINTYRTFLAILPTRHFCPHKLAAWIPSHTVWFTSWCQLRTWSHWAHPCWSKMGEWALPCLALAASKCSLPSLAALSQASEYVRNSEWWLGIRGRICAYPWSQWSLIFLLSTFSDRIGAIYQSLGNSE